MVTLQLDAVKFFLGGEVGDVWDVWDVWDVGDVWVWDDGTMGRITAVILR